jgi:hypothetical protein
MYIDGHAHLVHLVRWQTDNFHLSLRQQMDKLQTSKRIKENRLGFRFPFETAAYIYVVPFSVYIYIYIHGKQNLRKTATKIC